MDLGGKQFILRSLGDARMLKRGDPGHQYQGIASAVGMVWYLSVAKETRPSLSRIETEEGSRLEYSRWRYLRNAIATSVIRPFGASECFDTLRRAVSRVARALTFRVK